MSEVTALLFGGVALGALFDAYAYYRFKYAERALDVAQGRSGRSGAGGFEGGGEGVEAGQKTLAESVEEGEASEAGEGSARKTLAQRLAEIEGEREARGARQLSSEDATVVFEPGEGEELAAAGAVLERGSASGADGVGEGAVESGNGLSESVAALRHAVSRLDAVLSKKKRFAGSGSAGYGGGVSALGDSSEGASFSE
jgi:hypothetical protein